MKFGKWITLLTLLLIPVARAESPSTKKFEVQINNSAYLLGAGDRVRIDVFNVPEWSGVQPILSDGTITMPIVGSIEVNGKSSLQVADQISTLLEPYLQKSIVTVRVEETRPVGVVVSGAVNRPGPLVLDIKARATLSTALVQAGGLADGADLRRVSIVRHSSLGLQTYPIDLWKLLNGESDQDFLLRDGDAIQIPLSQNLEEDEDSDQVASSSLAPAIIRIQVVGEVINPGFKEVPANTTFTQALTTAGGLTDKADPGNVSLVRLLANGTIKQTTLAASLEQPRNQKTNPSLRNGDIIAVRRSFGGSLLQAVESFSGITLLLNLFR